MTRYVPPSIADAYDVGGIVHLKGRNFLIASTFLTASDATPREEWRDGGSVLSPRAPFPTGIWNKLNTDGG